MNQICLDPLWLGNLHVSVNQPPARPRQDLFLNGQRIGSVEPDCFEHIVSEGLDLRTDTFVIARKGAEVGWHITGQGTQALDHIAQVCRSANIGCTREQWRDEVLAVFNSQNQKVAGVERGVARLLGIATRAVHLVGYASNGHIWVQQRALGKAIDPGLWDTLVGGLIPETDNLTTALVRETWEEAGIKLDLVQQLQSGGNLIIRHPNALDGGMGYVMEQIDWFTGVIPDGVIPINQDGEVTQFALRDPVDLKSQLERNSFTLDASLILSRYLLRR